MSDDDPETKIDYEAAKPVVAMLVVLGFLAGGIGLGYAFGAWAGWFALGISLIWFAIRLVKYIEAHK